MNSYYNIFVGTENGLLKGINSITKSFNNLNSLENLNKEKEILAMCWSNEIKNDKIYFATRDQHIVRYDTDRDINAPFTDLGMIDTGKGIIRGLESISEDKLLTCTETGTVKVWKISTDGDVPPKLEIEFNVGSNIFCIRKCRFDNSIIATGGKENDLKVWNLSNESEKQCIFRAKNVADNWVQLREPIWIMSIDFVSEKKVAVGTGHHQVLLKKIHLTNETNINYSYQKIRVYDIKSGVRKPIYNLNFGLYPITSLIVVPDNSNRIIAANTRGEMEMIDLNVTVDKNGQSKVIRKFKGFQGTIKSIQLIKQVKDNSSNLLVATCGLDRYLRVHNVETGLLVSKVYLKSRLNCLIFSANEPVKAPKTNSAVLEKKLEDDELSNINSEDLGTDDLWSDMETVQDEYPNLKRKSPSNGNKKFKESVNTRMTDFDSIDENSEETEFKKPKLVPSLTKKSKKLKNVE